MYYLLMQNQIRIPPKNVCVHQTEIGYGQNGRTSTIFEFRHTPMCTVSPITVVVQTFFVPVWLPVPLGNKHYRAIVLLGSRSDFRFVQ